MQPHRPTAASGTGDAQAAAVAQSLVAGFGASQSVRYQAARCARVHGLGDAGSVCALEEIGLHRGDDEFALTAVPTDNGQPFAGGGGRSAYGATTLSGTASKSHLSSPFRRLNSIFVETGRVRDGA